MGTTGTRGFRSSPASSLAQSFIHASTKKTPDTIADKRVLVVGGGNSGCDLAVEAAIHGSRAVLSLRCSYPILPKLFRGLPIDALGERLLRWHFPIWLRRLVSKVVVRLALGPSDATGWPKPEHKLFESHPIINSRIHDRLAHGDLTIKPNVAARWADGPLCRRHERRVRRHHLRDRFQGELSVHRPATSQLAQGPARSLPQYLSSRAG